MDDIISIEDYADAIEVNARRLSVYVVLKLLRGLFTVNYHTKEEGFHCIRCNTVMQFYLTGFGIV